MAEIAWAALESFAENGFERTSMREVAHRAGTSHTDLLGYFSDERLLLLFALRLFEADAADVARNASASATSDIDVMVAVMAHQQRTPDRLRAWLAISVAASQEDHPARAFFADRAELAAGRVAGARADDGNVERALLYLVVVDGLQLQWLLNPDLDVESALRLFLTSSLYSPPK